MATYLKDLIETISEDIPTNIFTIEDEDPHVILGKINEVIKNLKNILGTISASDTKSKEALENSIKALGGLNDAIETANTSLEMSAEALDKSKQALDKITENVGTTLYDNNNNILSNARIKGHNGINVDMSEEDEETFDIRLDETITTAIEENHKSTQNLEANLINPNLLINADFRVNQREQSTYSNINLFCVDRWKLQDTELIYDVATKTLTNTKTDGWCYMFQKIEDSEVLKGKIVTISAKVDGVIYSKTVEIPTTFTNGNLEYLNIAKGNIFLQVYSNSILGFVFGLKPNQSEIIEWAKLEIGKVATAFSPRPYAEELAMCQRYFIRLKPNVNYGTFCNIAVTTRTTNADGTNTYAFNGFMPLPSTLRTVRTFKSTGRFTVLVAGIYTDIATALEHVTYNTNGVTVRASYTLPATNNTNNAGMSGTLRASSDISDISYIDIDAEIY